LSRQTCTKRLSNKTPDRQQDIATAKKMGFLNCLNGKKTKQKKTLRHANLSTLLWKYCE